MKNFTKLFALAVVILGFSATSFGQTAKAHAEIVTALGLQHLSNDLVFGKIVASGSIGTVIIPGKVAAAAISGAGATAVSGTTVTAADFKVVGADGQKFKISLPSSVSVIDGAGLGEPMLVNAFTSDVASAGNPVTGDASSTLTGTERTFYVGATLNVGINQAVGVYTSTTFPVTIQYE